MSREPPVECETVWNQYSIVTGWMSRYFTKKGAQHHINDTVVLHKIHLRINLISLSLICVICFSKIGSHAYNLSTLIPLSSSLIDLIRASLHSIWSNWVNFIFLDKNAFVGIRIIIKATPKQKQTHKPNWIICDMNMEYDSFVDSPASTDGPSNCHKKYIANPICSGADHTMLMYAVASIKRCASTAIKLTISPTVNSFRTEFDRMRDFLKMAPMSAARTRSPTVDIRWKWWVLKIVCRAATPNNPTAKTIPCHKGSCTALSPSLCDSTNWMIRRRICGEMNTDKSHNNLNALPIRKDDPNALKMIGKTDVRCFSDVPPPRVFLQLILSLE